MVVHLPFVQPLGGSLAQKETKDIPQWHFTTDSLQSDTQYLPVISKAPTKDAESHKKKKSKKEGRWRKCGGIDK